MDDILYTVVKYERYDARGEVDETRSFTTVECAVAFAEREREAGRLPYGAYISRTEARPCDCEWAPGLLYHTVSYSQIIEGR